MRRLGGFPFILTGIVTYATNGEADRISLHSDCCRHVITLESDASTPLLR